MQRGFILCVLVYNKLYVKAIVEGEVEKMNKLHSVEEVKQFIEINPLSFIYVLTKS